MKKKILKFSVLMLSASILFSSCNKKNEEEIIPDDKQEQSISAEDASSFDSESDQVANDADQIFSGSSSGMREDGIPTYICGLTKIDTLSATSYLLTFNGNSCDGKRKREGKISLTLNGSTWGSIGASLNIVYDNYKVTKLSTGRSIRLNGSKTLTNTIGGYIKDLTTTSDSVIHYISATDLKLTFDDNSERNWSTYRKRKIVRTSNGYLVTISALGSQGGMNDIATWGTNRKGIPFYTQIVAQSPIVFSKCTTWKPISGVMVHKGTKDLQVTFGFNASGTAVSGCEATHYKIEWTDLRGRPASALLPL